jgi:hypothetical protein
MDSRGKRIRLVPVGYLSAPIQRKAFLGDASALEWPMILIAKLLIALLGGAIIIMAL